MYVSFENAAGKLLAANAITFTTGSASLLQTARLIGKYVGEIQDHYGAIDAVIIEEFMKSYGNKSFHTQGLFKLAKLQGMVAAHAAELTTTEPVSIMPNAIRSFFNLKSRIPLLRGEIPSTKHIKYAGFDFCRQLYSDSYPFVNVAEPKFPSQSSPLFDVSDAVVTALFGVSKWWQIHLMEHPHLLSGMVTDSLPKTVERSADMHLQISSILQEAFKNIALVSSSANDSTSDATMGKHVTNSSILRTDVVKISKKTFSSSNLSTRGKKVVSFERRAFEDACRNALTEIEGINPKFRRHFPKAVSRALDEMERLILSRLQTSSASDTHTFRNQS